MPTISLRLTDEEHEQLKAWAHDGRRSVQKELIWRLFSEPTTTATIDYFPPLSIGITDDVNEIATVSEIAARLSSGSGVGEPAVSGTAPTKSEREPERSDPDSHFRPDPKPERKK